ncbi:hypothetical protein [Microbispora hainanensis]|uniref:Uncharacterized protein n=1 Tax=Microbispora hainanensis TaxID=568844 RepID=A0ABZ1SH96_9ACTN|nr:hypothetical protein [Microbispora hainanensis]
MRQDDTVRHGDEQEALARGNWRLLREALTRLALPASDQIEWLGSVLCPDELALDFDEAYQPSWQSREAGWISDEVAGYLDQINRLSNDLTEEGPEPWSTEGLQCHPTWERLRILARAALALMPPTPWASCSDD